MQKRREKWIKAAAKWKAHNYVFLDETWVKTNMTRKWGRGPKGERVVDWAPGGHWCTTTFLAGLSTDGLVAPLVVDGPMNGEVFLAWVEQHLVPALSPGQTVVMDNLSSHKVQGVASAIEAAGAKVLYLPPYSPDLNPIELVFSKLKALLRKYKERSLKDLWHRIGSLLDQFPPHECSNYFRHCGYGLH